MPTAELTILNSMAGSDLATQIAFHRRQGLRSMDLKNEIYGHWTTEVPLDVASRARTEIEAAGLTVHCLSTSIFFDSIEEGLAVFQKKHLGKVDHVIELARIFKPAFVRVTAAQLLARTEADAIADIRRDHSWVFDAYREVIDRVHEAGFNLTIENEVRQCFLSRTHEFLEFFEELDREGRVSLTWDVQNQWSTGVFPTVDVYDQLKALIRYCHFKGGSAEQPGGALAWNVALEEASWPVVAIAEKVVADDVSPVICLNPPQHGKAKPDYDYDAVTARDIDFLRKNVRGIA